MSPILVLASFSFFYQMTAAQDSTTTDDAASTPPVEVTTVPPNPPTSGLSVSQQFIVPETIADGVDSFKFQDREFLLVNTRMRHRHANLLCMKYNAQLATVKDEQTGNFLAEALSETNLILDTLWIWGSMENDKWMWKLGSNMSEPIDDAIIKKMVFSDQFGKDILKNCLGFARSSHDQPEYRPINCGAERSLICERSYVGGGGSGNSTHPYWITVGDRHYKIFRESVDYNTARMKCAQIEVGSDLAVIPNMKTVEILSRYLLIGRPSLENAWIQAKYMNDQFTYPGEKDVVLSNATDSGTGFPPWRNGAIQKPSGCVLLDRHLSNKTLFVEARCQRMRPYICYKRGAGNNSTGVETTDAVIKEYGYRLVYNPMPWADASYFCNSTYKEFEGKLAETVTLELVLDITFFMGEYKVAVDHIWIGGRMENEKWIWNSNSNDIDASLMQTYGIANTSYWEEAEEMNVCLNFDRENHFVPFIYGTICSYPQSFICMFAKDKFLELKEKEKKEQDNTI